MDSKLRRIPRWFQGDITFSSMVAMMIMVFVSVSPVSAGEIQAKPAIMVEKISSFPYSQALAKFEAAVKGARMIIVGEPNYQMMQRMVGRERKGAKGYFIFRPDLGTPIFDNDPKAALEIPLKVVFLEQPDGKVRILYYKPSTLLANYKGLGSLGTDLDNLLDQLTGAVMK